MKNIKIAVVICGCGSQDGSEISETVFTLLSLSMNNLHYSDYEVFSPSLEFSSISHFPEYQSQKRNTLNEASRITHGFIKNLNELKEKDFDMIIFPGGYGTKSILAGLDYIKKIIIDFHKAKKPIIGICLAPCIISHSIDNTHITYGAIDSFRTDLELPNTKVSAIDIDDHNKNYLFDEKNNIYTTPAFMTSSLAMSAPNLNNIFRGIFDAISTAIKNIKK